MFVIHISSLNKFPELTLKKNPASYMVLLTSRIAISMIQITEPMKQILDSENMVGCRGADASNKHSLNKMTR